MQNHYRAGLARVGSALSRSREANQMLWRREEANQTLPRGREANHALPRSGETNQTLPRSGEANLMLSRMQRGQSVALEEELKPPRHSLDF